MLIQEYKSSPGQRWPKGAALGQPGDQGKLFVLIINNALSSPNPHGLFLTDLEGLGKGQSVHLTQSHTPLP